ncbi:MAG: UDP-N-acetylmuramoyl-L-alanyl-D-glutamate--2,6-diaminopimelate ligase [Chitinophagaceae bacterium]|nr:UDP-N-acetylmuramoyl-L-alanyl-D-glutamate--2,6-diaminopimelate ligase [Chitinophagaceae bacterium]
MQKLHNILKGIALQSVSGEADIEIKGISIDSRKIEKGWLFVAIKGTQTDGHRFIDKAIEQGAAAIIFEEGEIENPGNVILIRVKDSASAAGIAAHNFYDQPSHKFLLVGVTGTNGKTTIATLLFKLFRKLGYSCGLVSTVQNQINDEIVPASHTTPDAVNLNALLAGMADAGCSHVFMESSSHAIHQKRMEGLRFAGGIFSNITHDHLDYHKTFDEYIRVKKSFFDDLPDTAFSLSNLDDKRGAIMLQNTNARRLYYSLLTMADFKGKILENGLTGLVMDVNGQEVHFRLIGAFNAYNLLAVYGAAIALDEDKEEVLSALSSITGAEGRFDVSQSPGEGIIGIVDYAHTPDALLNVLTTIKQLRKGDESVITVVGCGGDRDKTKRPLMAEAACEYSHKCIFTSDNPRTEDPEAILNDMVNGLKSEYKRRSLVIRDRREAIKTAVMLARPGDIVLIAGKGHEKYQEINGVKHHFDDKEELNECFKER